MTNAPEAVDALGISYRQLDYWTTRGYLKAVEVARGQGYPREWTDAELSIAARIRHLLALGFTLAFAAKLARQIESTPWETSYRLDEEITLEIDRP